MGYVFLLVAVVLYALYEVLFKVLVEGGGEHEHVEEAQNSPSMHQSLNDHSVPADDALLIDYESPLLQAGLGEAARSTAKLAVLAGDRARSLSETSSGGSVSSGAPMLEDAEHSRAGKMVALRVSRAASPRAVPAPANKHSPMPLLLELEQSMGVMGLMGLVNLAFVWVFIPLLTTTKVEVFAWPDPGTAKIIALNALLDSTFTAFLLFGVCITSPLVMSLGSMNVVPVSVLVDWMVHGVLPSPLAAIGICFVVVGFLIQNLKLPWAICAKPLCKLR